MQPCPLIAQMYLRRAALIWLTMRLVISLVFLLAGADPLGVPLGVAAAMVGTSVGLLFADIGLHHEQLLIANLATSNAAIAMIAAVPGIAGEVALALVFRPAG
jgi:hypothetical protein